jgi:hypothetical protein
MIWISACSKFPATYPNKRQVYDWVIAEYIQDGFSIYRHTAVWRLALPGFLFFYSDSCKQTPAVSGKNLPIAAFLQPIGKNSPG